MYGKASDNQAYISRTGSHATKPHPTGRIDDIPAWAAEPEQYYNKLRDEYRVWADQLKDTQAKLNEIHEKLRFTLPLREYEHLKQHQECLGDKVRALQEKVMTYRPLVRALGEKAWANVFVYVAETLLSKEELYAIRDETRALLKREPVEIAKGRSERSLERHHSRTLSDNRRERRVRSRKHRTGSVLVWSDEAPNKNP